MPETSVLMKLIDEQKPEFMYSLHNAGFGGTYWYITYELKEIWEKLHLASAKQQIPLSLGEPEAPYMIQFAPAIFKMTGSQDAYDYDEKYADEPAETLMVAGTSSDDYAKKYGTCCLVTELPYFYSPKIASAKRMGFARKEAMRQGAEIKLANWRKIEDLYALYKTDVSSDNPFAKMLNMMIKLRDSSYKSMLKFIESKPEFNDECKESEAFDNIEITKFYALLGWGLAVRGAEHERDKRQGSEYQRLEKIVQQIDAAMKVMADDVEASIAYSVVPIKKLVSIQLESGMIVADQLRQRRQRDV
ncbi:hypothetical protein SDC9_106319 [bioreactor metagenome]|uniref:Peptidase M14 carboxypeptidase A domain-containing protein n=1 Tax=bioreactor metagenome TaxID=1076179 RepID=A0A645B210_9ZZZZ